jgi:GDPmannose 4,6-dehydratase
VGALITGITGQDGLFLGQQLLSRGYDVYGLVRGQNNPKVALVRSLMPGVRILQGDLTDFGSLIRALETSRPDEVYNLAAISYVALSWQQPQATAEVTGLGALRMLEAVRLFTNGRMDTVRFFQASSSEVFGNAAETPQSELTPFRPRSPYGAAKAFAHHITVNYRESYGAWACCGIAFNHESERRGTEFVSRKVTRAAARISLGREESLSLGNLDSRRDWGFAGDYTDAMWRILQHGEPDDYVIATGEAHSVRELVSLAFECVGISNWSRYVHHDASLIRPAEVDFLMGDARKAERLLGWTAQVIFRQLIERMCRFDLVIESNSSA